MKSKVQIHSLLIASGLFSFTTPVSFARAAECPTARGETFLSASFEWEDTEQRRIPMHLTVTRAKNSRKAKAWISSSAGCEAVCEIVAGADSEDAYDLNCRSAGFGTLSAKATLFARRTGPAQRSPAVLRFGTWIDGYRQVQLAVSVNRTSRLQPRPIVASKLAQAR